ncbi:MAG: serine acetyltransferase [Bacteroidaceae bacterium]|nr:serine acetyltransferase [Bacteroidaceae bacterium]
MLIHWYRLSHWLWRHHIPLFPTLIWRLQYLLFNSSVPASCTLKEGVKFAYGGIGVVIHARAVVGKNCMIGQGVTIGGKSGWYEVPIIGDHVEISAGARIIGPVRIGNHVIIGANSVVVKDVPDNCVVAGVPARIIRSNLSEKDFAEMEKYKERGNAPFPVTPTA